MSEDIHRHQLCHKQTSWYSLQQPEDPFDLQSSLYHGQSEIVEQCMKDPDFSWFSSQPPMPDLGSSLIWPGTFQPGNTSFHEDESEAITNEAITTDSTTKPLHLEPSFHPGQKCQFPGCPETRSFNQNSAFKKHLNKHLRPFPCPRSTCKVTPFATKGDLRRHEREVHSAPGVFHCPVGTCKRNVRGCSRKCNLVLHLDRSHEGVNLALGGGDKDVEKIEGGVLDEGLSGGEGGGKRGERADEGKVMKTVEGNDKIVLMIKLKELEDEKAKAVGKFNGDIEALKRVLSFM